MGNLFQTTSTIVLFFVLSPAVAGCGVEEEAPKPAPEFPEGSGQPPAGTEADYPEGPYGVSIGSVVTNFGFVGYINAREPDRALNNIYLSDFYNPSGDGMFPEGSPYGSGPKPTALFLSLAAVWCPPCQYEAAEILPGKRIEYWDDRAERRGQFLVTLAEGASPGNPVTFQHLDNWADQYDIDYPLVIDPAYKLAILTEAAAWPANFIVDTRTMAIVDVATGVMQESFWTKFEAVMDGAY